MSRRVTVFLFLLLTIVMGATIISQAQPQSLLTRHVRDVAIKGQAPFVGRLPATRTMHIDVVLALRDEAGLDRFLAQVYDRTSPLFHHYVTVEQFADRFGPSRKDYDALIRFANANGLKVVGGSRNAMDVQLKGSVAAIETAFHIRMGLYHDPIENRNFYAPDREPTVDLPFQLWHVSGLDNYFIPRPALVQRPANLKLPPITGSCPGPSFCGSDMRAGYYEGKTLTGKGQYIGLLEYLGFDIDDVNTYYKNIKQKRTATVKGISTDGSSLSCLASQGCDDTEQTIDITQALGMAPGVKTLFMYVGSTDTALLGAMTSDKPLPLNLSSSWYWYPPDPSTDNPYFKKMASQGQSFFEAAGDDGKWQQANLWWPMESQYVICVGGTDLTTKGGGGPWQSETTWVDGGGGISPDDVKIPSWQKLKGVITKSNEGSTKFRNGPDLAANSNFSFYVCADQRGCTSNQIGGTSFAAPMWAGYIALANQQAAANGDNPPGFIDPAIYPLGLGSNYKNDFHDITSGSNGFPAVKGYDLATGWGSPNKAGLINDLLGGK